MYPIVMENESVKVTETWFAMEDGAKLYTRIAVPAGAEKCPIVYMRTPYEEPHGGLAHPLEESGENTYIRNGYALVLQHCRGTGDSEGVCIPYHERDDGLRTLELIRGLPCYDGEIYVAGGSYLSTVHLSYLNTEPTDVKGAALDIQTDRMYFRNYRNGCCAGFCNLDWWLKMMKRQYPNPRREGIEIRPYKDIMKRAVGEDVPDYTRCLMNDEYNEFWKNDPRTDVISHLKMPVLFTEGWYDCYTEGMFSMWERLPEETKAKSAFVVGPWTHKTKVSDRAEYPLPKGNIAEDYAVRWFNSIRNKTPYPHAEYGKVNYYSIGGDFWTSDDYPRQAKSTKRLYFHADKTLSERPHFPCGGSAKGSFERELSYRYDPNQRMNYFRYHGIYGDIFRAREKDTVEGVITFESAEFTDDMNFYGRPHWHMRVRTDCADTAFYARIYFVENGQAYNLTDTITSLSHLNRDYQAGQVQLIDIDFPPIAFTVRKGNRIRIDVASDGEIYVPHSNTRGHWAEVTKTRVATNVIICDGEAYVELPCR